MPAVDLHGNLSQPARERNLAAFADGSCRVLVATDIAARGIHVDDVALVIHVDPPVDHKAYLHRSGRTARAGAAGDVVTVMTRDQLAEVKDLARKAGIRPTTAHVAPGDPRIVALTGEPAPYVTPAATPVVTGPAANRRRPPGPGAAPAAGPGRAPAPAATVAAELLPGRLARVARVLLAPGHDVVGRLVAPRLPAGLGVAGEQLEVRAR